MTPIVIATGITPNFIQRAKCFLESLKVHNRVPSAIFCVRFSPADYQNKFLEGHRLIEVDYANCLNVPKWQLQHGAFTVFIPPDWSEDTVVVFCDADAYFQRNLSEQEIDLMVAKTKNGEFMVGRNKPDWSQSLENEAVSVANLQKIGELESAFPYYKDMVCRNWGFVAAKVSAWRRLYSGVCEKWPDVARLFWNPAMVQWICCYIAQRDSKIVDLPITIHSHGHLGLPTEVTRENGIWMANQEIIAYAHAL